MAGFPMDPTPGYTPGRCSSLPQYSSFSDCYFAPQLLKLYWLVRLLVGLPCLPAVPLPQTARRAYDSDDSPPPDARTRTRRATSVPALDALAFSNTYGCGRGL